jgi:acyl-CoA synthetase (AMP-forming)/AMP-acid ligase II
LATGYGLTETSSITASISGNDYVVRPTSVGIPVPICEVRIVDADGRDVPSGESGEIWIKGANVVPGYWQRPEETAAAFTEGWLHSGDIGRLDDEGFLYIVDRTKNMVIRGGENISTLEVESVLIEHPDVIDAAVFARRTPRWAKKSWQSCAYTRVGRHPPRVRPRGAHLAPHKVRRTCGSPTIRSRETRAGAEGVIQAEYALVSAS